MWWMIQRSTLFGTVGFYALREEIKSIRQVSVKEVLGAVSKSVWMVVPLFVL